MTTLTERIQALPQELFDEIRQRTLAAMEHDIPRSTTIDEHYIPPAQLSISRELRAVFAPKYYNLCSFRLPEGTISGQRTVHGTSYNLVKWLESIAPKYRNLIGRIELAVSRTAGSIFFTRAGDCLNSATEIPALSLVRTKLYCTVVRCSKDGKKDLEWWRIRSPAPKTWECREWVDGNLPVEMFEEERR